MRRVNYCQFLVEFITEKTSVPGDWSRLDRLMDDIKEELVLIHEDIKQFEASS